jgi:hypothetical protein
VNVHTWIANDLQSVRDKLSDSVLSVVPKQRWVEHADDGGSSIAHLVLHIARHHDLALTTAIRDRPPTFFEHRDALGLAGAPASAGLPEREDSLLTALVPLEPLVQYFDTVFATTDSWLDHVGSMMLDTVPDCDRRLTELADLSADEVGWLHRMWNDKPVWWLLQWPIVGHGHAHVGEAISIRNRMGLSPF